MPWQCHGMTNAKGPVASPVAKKRNKPTAKPSAHARARARGTKDDPPEGSDEGVQTLSRPDPNPPAPMSKFDRQRVSKTSRKRIAAQLVQGAQDDAGVDLEADAAEGMRVAGMKARIVELMAEESLSPIGAAKKCGVDRATYWEWRRADPRFVEAMSQAYIDGTDRLKDLAVENAKGSDFLLLNVIKGRDASWRDPKYAAPVNNGPKNSGMVEVDPNDAAMPKELRTLLTLYAREKYRQSLVVIEGKAR